MCNDFLPADTEHFIGILTTPLWRKYHNLCLGLIKLVQWLSRRWHRVSVSEIGSEKFLLEAPSLIMSHFLHCWSELFWQQCYWNLFKFHVMARCVLHRNTYLIYKIIYITQVIFWRYFGGTYLALLFHWIKWLWYLNWILKFLLRLFIDMLIFLSFIELNDLIFVCYFLDCILKIYRSCYLNVLI